MNLYYGKNTFVIHFKYVKVNFKEKALTEILLVSGSAMTPDVLRSKSPMLRVMASLPLTCG